MADESSYVAEWLHDTLSGDVQLTGIVSGVYEDPAPQDTAYPVCVFSLISAFDVQGHNANRIFVDSLWLVKVVAQSGSFSAARTSMDIVDNLLHKASGSVVDALVYSATREQIIRYAETDDGRPYKHLGAQYRVLVQYVGG